MTPDMLADSGCISVRVWSADEFAASGAIWDELLLRSEADPLFMCWDWQWRWWMHHHTSLQADLCLVGVYAGSELVGLAPFYAHRASVRGVLHPRRMQILGTAWRDSGPAFSDYLEILVDRACRSVVIAAVAKWLEASAWDELVLCCLRRGGAADELARTHMPRIARVREVDPLVAWRASLPAHFEEFVQRLSPDVRRRVLNQRRKLRNARVCYANETEITGYLNQMWRYTESRWGGDGASPEFRQFYTDIAHQALRQGQLRLSRLETDDGIASVMFNKTAGNCVYYLQSGFDPSTLTGISPGYLHFGYAIEHACAEGAQYFDFLGGSGRNRDYKRDLLTENVPVVTYHAVRGALSRGLYATYGACTEAIGRLRQAIG